MSRPGVAQVNLGPIMLEELEGEAAALGLSLSSYVRMCMIIYRRHAAATGSDHAVILKALKAEGFGFNS